MIMSWLDFTIVKLLRTDFLPLIFKLGKDRFKTSTEQCIFISVLVNPLYESRLAINHHALKQLCCNLKINLLRHYAYVEKLMIRVRLTPLSLSLSN